VVVLCEGVGGELSAQAGRDGSPAHTQSVSDRRTDGPTTTTAIATRPPLSIENQSLSRAVSANQSQSVTVAVTPSDSQSAAPLLVSE